jgi:hypothetical protein
MMGRKAIIVKALYGLKSSGKAWHAHLAGTHTDDLLVVGPSGLPDKIITTLWTIFTNKGGSEPEFHLGCDYKKASLYMSNQMGKQVENQRQAEPPEYYPIATVVSSKKEIVDLPQVERDFWFIGTKTYIQEALVRCTKIMKLDPIVQGGKTISPVEQIRKFGTPIVIMTGYNPHADTMEPCGPNKQQAYQQLLGIALWIIMCGRYDISIGGLPKFEH